MTYLRNRINTFKDIKQDLINGLNRYNNYDIITLEYLTGLLSRDSFTYVIKHLFEDSANDAYEIISDYTIVLETGNLVLNYKADGNCNFNYRFEINLARETVTLVATPKPTYEFANGHNYFLSKCTDMGTHVFKNFVDARTTHVVKKQLLPLHFLRYLRSVFLYELAQELKTNYNKYQEEATESLYFAEKIRENIEKIDRIEDIVDKTSLRHYGFEKFYKKLLNSAAVS